jgi:CubicO group peptidase (beta-lactamase class C family)
MSPPKITIIAVWLGLTLVTWTCSAADAPWPTTNWEQARPADVGMDEVLLEQARDYALTGGGSGFITRHGKLVMSWGDVRRRYDLKSTTKSIGVTALGLAIADGKIALSDFVLKHHPTFGVPPESNRKTGWIDRITIQHLATQTGGFEKPGGYSKLAFELGTQWGYSDSGPNWLAECVTLAYRRDVDELMFERVFTPLGITRKDLTWRRNSYRPKDIDGITRREFGSGISANVNAMARLGYLYLRGGAWNGQRIIPEEFVNSARTTVKSVVGIPETDAKNYGNASDHYGLLWWNNADGTLKNVPRDAYWSWGLYESLILVIPSLDIVVARAGKSWKGKWAGHYDVLERFFDPIVAAVGDSTQSAKIENESRQAYPPSPIIKSIKWAAASTIVRKAKGSDNWPITWGDDDALYTAYGDGRGFQPFVEKKLSMGLCRVLGGPQDFRGINLRSTTAERTGGGAGGPKASGLLMVDGVLYMLVRNTGNSQLAWSVDRGKIWTWSDWKFSTSFGYPTFLNFGRNYANARDDFVYVYSHDSDSAYKRADRMVLARVPADRVKKREAYEFFEKLDDSSPV